MTCLVVWWLLAIQCNNIPSHEEAVRVKCSRRCVLAAPILPKQAWATHSKLPLPQW